MAQVIRIRRRIGVAGTPAPGAPATLSAGELAYNRPDFTDGPDDLYVGDNTGAVHALVSSSRQVELQGPQTITGLKSFAVGGATPSIALTGGANGNVLTTNGSGVLAWAATPPATVQVDDPIEGDGAAATPLTVKMATGAQIATGTDDVFPIDSAGLRTQLGAAASAVNLGTTATTVVPAIHELSGKITTLSGAIIVVGNYNANTHQVAGVRPPAAPGLADGASLPPATGHRGWLFLVSVAGTGAAPAPAVPMAVGDWVVSNDVDWVHLSMGLASIAAGNVSVTAIDSTGWTTVQAALQGLFTTKLSTVAVDGTSITGTGVTSDELEVALVDCGTY